MIGFLRTISVILLATLILTIGLGIALRERWAEGPGPVGLFAAVTVFIVFTLPLLGVYFWLMARRGRLQDLTDDARSTLASPEDRRIDDRAYGRELAGLARALEEWRLLSLRHQGRLSERERVLRHILEAIGEGFLGIDRDGKIVLANRRSAELLGVQAPLAGHPLVGVIRNAALHEAFDRARAGEKSSRMITVEGGELTRHLDVHVLPVEGVSDVAAAALFVDVTRLIRLERVRRDFLADFTHEVRTPLAGLRSASETLEHGKLRPEDEETLRRIVARQIERLERLVSDLAELSRIETGELELTKRPTDLAALLQDVAGDFREKASARKVVLEIAGEPVVAAVDPQRVEQILANLVDNAIKFSPPDARVVLRAERRANEDVVEVTDQGEGIEPADQERVFHRFYRVDKSRSQEVPGTGLGLAVVKHLVARHGGRVELKSEPGRGTTFRLFFPREPGT